MFAIYGPNTVGKVPQFYIFICNFLPIVGWRCPSLRTPQIAWKISWMTLLCFYPFDKKMTWIGDWHYINYLRLSWQLKLYSLSDWSHLSSRDGLHPDTITITQLIKINLCHGFWNLSEFLSDLCVSKTIKLTVWLVIYRLQLSWNFFNCTMFSTKVARMAQ